MEIQKDTFSIERDATATVPLHLYMKALKRIEELKIALYTFKDFMRPSIQVQEIISSALKEELNFVNDHSTRKISSDQ